ncbi:MAG: hypothetical protein ACHP7O_07835 [Burkholderiales bacterium]
MTELAMAAAGEELIRRGVTPPAATPVDDEPDSPLPEEEASFETVARSYTPTDMHILRGRLEADGIPAFVVDDNINQTNSLLAVATGGVRLQVASHYAQEAARIIAEVKSGNRALENGVPEAPEVPASDQAAEAPAPNWEIVACAAIFIFALVEFARTMWFARTFGADIVWDYVSIFAMALPMIYFVAALLLVFRSKWALLCFSVHLPFSMALVLFLTPGDPIRIDEIIGWACTVAIIYFCLYLRRQGRLG